MARIDHGNRLQIPVLKPGSTRFTLTEYGFDVGSRTFSIDEDFLAESIPELERPDTDLVWDSAAGSRRGSYGTMFVASVTDITEATNGICEYTVNFLGLIKRQKRDYQTDQTATSTCNGVLAETGLTKRFYESTPVVTIVKVRNSKPDPLELGTSIIPPGWEDFRLETTIKGVAIPQIPKARWVLRERDKRKCGPMYEFRDQFVYDVTR